MIGYFKWLSLFSIMNIHRQILFSARLHFSADSEREEKFCKQGPLYVTDLRLWKETEQVQCSEQLAELTSNCLHDCVPLREREKKAARNNGDEHLWDNLRVPRGMLVSHHRRSALVSLLPVALQTSQWAHRGQKHKSSTWGSSLFSPDREKRAERGTERGARLQGGTGTEAVDTASCHPQTPRGCSTRWPFSLDSTHTRRELTQRANSRAWQALSSSPPHRSPGLASARTCGILNLSCMERGCFTFVQIAASHVTLIHTLHRTPFHSRTLVFGGWGAGEQFWTL